VENPYYYIWWSSEPGFPRTGFGEHLILIYLTTPTNEHLETGLLGCKEPVKKNPHASEEVLKESKSTTGRKS